MSELNKALFKVTNELKSVLKDSQGQFGHYASLETVLDAVKPVLEKHSLFLLQPLDVGTSGSILRTMIIHAASGESLDSSVNLVTEKPGPQGLGASITYLRRYSVLSLLGVATGDDPDAGQARPSQRSSYAPKPQPQSQHRPATTWDNELIGFGKFKDKTYAQVPINELINYRDWLVKSSDEQGKPMSKNAEYFVTAVGQITSMLSQSATQDFAPNDDIPF